MTIHGDLLRMKAKHHRLEQEYKRKSTIERLFLNVKSYCYLNYLYYFNRAKYDALIKLKELCDRLKQTNLTR